MPRPWRTLLAGLASAIVVAGMPGTAAEPFTRSAAITSHEHDVAGAETAKSQATLSMVTLITGDRIRVTTQADGATTVVPMPLPGRESKPVSIRYRGDRIEAVPSDARPLLRAGRLDPRLFDVAGLVAAGYDDRSTSQLPLVARHAPGRSSLAKNLVGATAVRSKTTGSSTALSVRKKDAARFWRWLTGPHPAEVGHPRPTGGAFAAGLTTVSLRVPNPAARPVSKASAHRPVTSHPGGTTRPAAAPSSAPSPGAATHNLILRIIDRNGQLVKNLDEHFVTQPVVRNLDTDDVYNLEPRAAGIGAQVPPGTYSFGEIIVCTHGFKPTSYTMAARPHFTVGDANLTLTVDTRTAHEVKARIQAPNPKPIVTTLGTVEFFAARPWTTLVTIPAGTAFRAFATPTAEVTDRPYNFAMFQSLDTPWGIYDLLVGDAGRIPSDTDYSIRNVDLSRVTSRFFSTGTDLGLRGVFFREAQLPGDVQVGLGWFYDTSLPANQVHFTSPGFGAEPLPWASSLDVGRDPTVLRYSELRTPTVLPAGQNVEAPWSRASFRPEGAGERMSDRTLSITFEPFSPALDDAQVVWWNDQGISGRATLTWAGGVLGAVDEPFILRTENQALPLTWYELDLLARHDTSWSKYATAVHAYWKFLADAEDDPLPIPLLNVFPTGKFDQYNRAPAGQPFRLELPVTVPTEHAGTPTSTALAASFDDGKTWTNVPTVRDSALLWHAIVTHPNKPGGYVSLRAKVFTDNGHVYSMTTIRAYGLGPAAS